MELLIIAFVCDVRLEDLADPRRDSMICSVSVRLLYGDMVDNDSDERIICVCTTADEDVVALGSLMKFTIT
jgi:hypothetical protein